MPGMRNGARRRLASLAAHGVKLRPIGRQGRCVPLGGRHRQGDVGDNARRTRIEYNGAVGQPGGIVRKMGNKDDSGSGVYASVCMCVCVYAVRK